jgi:5'-nucleotidase
MGGVCCTPREGKEGPEKQINYPFSAAKDTLRFFHFSDVSEIADQNTLEVASGAPRFVTALARAQKRAEEWRRQVQEMGKQFGDITVFSGDLLSPSQLSSQYEGAQMISPFNACKVDVSMPGNHDFDFGVDQCRKCIAQMTTNEYRPVGLRDED